MTPALKLSWRYCITDLLWGKFLCQASLCHLGRRRLFQSQTNYWGRDAVHDFLLMTSDSPSSGRLRGSGTKINTRGHFTMVSSLEGTLRGTLLCFIYHRFIQEGICWSTKVFWSSAKPKSPCGLPEFISGHTLPVTGSFMYMYLLLNDKKH